MTKFLALFMLALPVAAVAQYPNMGPGPPPQSSIVSVATAGALSLTGATIETNIAVLRVPAGSMGKNGTVDVKCLWSYTNSANNKILTIRWSNTSGAVAGTAAGAPVTVTTSVSAQTEHIVRNNNATGAQTIFPAIATAPYGTSAAANAAATVDTTVDSFLNINGTLALGTETITVQHCTALIVKAP